MPPSFVCVCDASFNCLRGLTTHKQTCKQAQDDTKINYSVLRSISMLGAGASANGVNVAGGTNDDNGYQIAEYNIDDNCIDGNGNDISSHDEYYGDTASEDDDDHSTTIRFDELGDIYDDLQHDGEDHYFDCIDDSDMSWSSSSSLSSSDSESSVLSFDDNPLPEYTPLLFPTVPPHLSAAYEFQVDMNSLLDQNKASLTMYDKIIWLMNNYITSPEFNRNVMLKTRKQFMAYSEKLFNIESLKPTNGNVKLCDSTVVTVPVFDAQSMILSILHDPSIMKQENFALGYDIFTGAQDDSECNKIVRRDPYWRFMGTSPHSTVWDQWSVYACCISTVRGQITHGPTRITEC